MVEIRLLSKKPLYLRPELLFLVFIFPLTIAPCVRHVQECWVPDEPVSPSNSTFAFIFDHVDGNKLEPYLFQVLFPVVSGVFCVLLMLAPYWSIKLRVKMHFTPATEKNATHVVCIPEQYKGKPDVVPIKRDEKYPYIVFCHKKRRLVNGEWVSLQYPNNFTIGEYLASRGLTEKEAEKRLVEFGKNAYEVPIPGFMEMMTAQMRTPVFVCNTFIYLLYLLSEYLTYPLMSLAMSVGVLAMEVKTRQKHMNELKGAESPVVLVYVKRDGAWKKIMSDKVVPGDVMLLHREQMAPCDMLVCHGRAVVNEAMLTGESTPQVKDSASSLPADVKLDVLEIHRRYVIFAGTNVEQLLPDGDCAGLPENGIVCVVLATGLGSTQGKLIRTILHSRTDQMGQSKDGLLLILFLSIFAFAASGYIWVHAKKRGENSFSLLLRTSLILLATLPLDLPQLTNIAVTTAALGLSRLKTYSTEPYRIADAGLISVCCFDKTGTLTAEEYRMIGVDDMNGAPKSKRSAEISGEYYTDASDMPAWALRVIGGCHSLVRGSYGQLVGDSLEATGFATMRFKLMPDGGAEHERGAVRPIKAFHFSSDLMRMTVVCSIDDEDTPYALMKGAPEKVAELLESVPQGYNEANMRYTRQGCRVLAMAYKPIDTKDAYDPHLDRAKVEQKMRFAGFMIFSAAIKRGSEDVIVNLLRSNHRCIIITGDNPLTACHVAKLLHMTTKKPAIHDVTVTDENGVELKSDEGYELCYTGKALDKASDEELNRVINRCNIFARMSPSHKARIVIKLQSLGYKVMMCGDGTNDVHALRQASVGVGLVEDNSETVAVDPDDPSAARLGAASIAAPFVAKRGTITGCVDLIRFGRSTLASVLDNSKQICLDALISAYSSSVLQLEHVKFGDWQMTALQFFTSGVEMAMAWAVPRRTLSKERPIPGQFNTYLICSVLGQFGVHLFFLYLTHKLVFGAGFVIDRYNARANFSPSLLNTAIFLLKGEMELLTAVVNYAGKPFMQSIFENKQLLMSFVGGAAVIVVFLADLHPWIMKTFQLVHFPSRKFQATLGLYMLGDAILTLTVEQLCRWFFMLRNQRKLRGLVSEDVVRAVENYIPNDDDAVVESCYNLGVMDVLKENVAVESMMQMKNRQRAIADQKKKQAEEKAREEAERFNTNKK